jgi:hypothetical protein
MANRKHFLTLIMILCAAVARAQSLTFPKVDSTSYAKYVAADWKALVDYGNTAISTGVDYPILRLRIAYAQFLLGNYSGALVHYQNVLASDSHNQTARYYSYLCNDYLNRSNDAAYNAAYIDTVTLNKEQIKPFGALQAGLEVSAKNSNNSRRGTGLYSRAFFSNRLGWHIQLDQSVAYYNQAITSTTAVTSASGAPAIATPITGTYTDSQIEYYAKLGYSLAHNLALLVAYHYLGTSYGTSTYQNHIGLIGLKYSAPYFALQADANLSTISNSNTQQYNGQLTIYPLGNLNLYTISRVSAQNGAIQQTIFTQTLGFKAVKQLWLEASGSFGRLDNFLDADALYVYNSIDITTFRAGASAFYPLGKHAVVFLNYTFEQKQDYYLNNNFNQNSITGGLTWKF